jgi:hypothetical protein
MFGGNKNGGLSPSVFIAASGVTSACCPLNPQVIRYVGFFSSAIVVSNQFYLFQVKIKDRFAASFSFRHRRVGPIFRNRCKSILCQVQETSYLS